MANIYIISSKKDKVYITEDISMDNIMDNTMDNTMGNEGDEELWDELHDLKVQLTNMEEKLLELDLTIQELKEQNK